MRRGHNVAFGIAIAACISLGSMATAHAQYQPYQPPPPPPGYGPPPGYYPPPPPPPRGMYRHGLVIGGALGGAVIDAQDCGDVCGGSLSLEGHIGGMINPRLALMGDFWANIRSIPNSDATTWSGIYTAALQYWVNDIFWLKGGLGIGHMQIYSNTQDVVFGDETGLAAMGAAGVELIQSSVFALDIQGRLGHGFYSQGGDVNNFAFLVGVNWY